uniref:Cyclic nucleotide-binding domain-containing protein n=1 Tax=Panagrolaimus sp. ES5 TaxID=591445 RepID=A0AC34F8Z9_9BILA
MTIFIASDMVEQRKYKLERIRLSALNLLQHMTGEMKFSKDLFPTTKDYNLALKVNHDFNQIIDAMLRQAMRMVGFELNQSITNLSDAGFTEPESRDKWLHRIELLKDLADNLIDVPSAASVDKLRDVDWIYLLPFEQQEYVVQKLSEFIETGNLEIVSKQVCIYTHGTHFFFIRKGICKVTEIQNVKRHRICHDYYIYDGSFIGIKNIFKMGKNGNKFQPLKNLETSFRACTDVELVKIEATKLQKLFQDVAECWGTISMVEQKRRLRADLKRVSSEYGLMTDAEIAHETLTFYEVRGKKILSLGVGKVFIPGIALHVIAHPEGRIDEFRNVLGPANVTIQPITPEIVGLYLELIRPDMSERKMKSSMIAANIPMSPDTTERQKKK